MKHDIKTVVLGTAFIADHSQVLDRLLGQRPDEILGNSYESETADQESATGRNVFDGIGRVLVHLHEMRLGLDIERLEISKPNGR